MNDDNNMPLYCYRIYRKALRDIRNALEKCESGLKIYGMNNIKGCIAAIDMALTDIEILSETQSLEGYAIPEFYLKKYRKKIEKKKKEK